jgi:hypothetical protein
MVNGRPTTTALSGHLRRKRKALKVPTQMILKKSMLCGRWRKPRKIFKSGKRRRH